MITFLGADCDPTWNSKQPVGTSPTFSLQLIYNNRSPASICKDFLHMPKDLTFTATAWGMGPWITWLWMPTRISWIPQDTQAVFLNRLRSLHPQLYTRVQCRGSGQLLAFPVVAWVVAHLLISLHLGADSNHSLRDTDGSSHTLNYWEAGVGWQRFQRQSGAQAGLIDKIHLLTSVSKD